MSAVVVAFLDYRDDLEFGPFLSLDSLMGFDEWALRGEELTHELAKIFCWITFNIAEISGTTNQCHFGELRLTPAYALGIDQRGVASNQETIWQRRRGEKEADISVGHACRQPQVQFFEACLYAYLFCEFNCGLAAKIVNRQWFAGCRRFHVATWEL